MILDEVAARVLQAAESMQEVVEGRLRVLVLVSAPGADPPWRVSWHNVDRNEAVGLLFRAAVAVGHTAPAVTCRCSNCGKAGHVEGAPLFAGWLAPAPGHLLCRNCVAILRELALRVSPGEWMAAQLDLPREAFLPSGPGQPDQGEGG